MALFGAWHAAVFQRQKKVPDLSKIMNRLDDPTPTVQTPDVLMRKARMLAATLGGKWHG